MLDNQQLFKFIPKHIRQWTQDDVSQWFKINDIQLSQSIKFNGMEFMNLTPNKLMHELKLSSFLTRKISDWIQFQTSDFDSYVDEVLDSQKNQSLNSSPFEGLSLKEQIPTNETEGIQVQQDKNFIDECTLKNNSDHQSGENSEKKQQKRQIQQCQLQQEQVSQMYKPSKYHVRKNLQHSGNLSQSSVKHSQSVRQIPQHNKKSEFKKMFVLKDLSQNQVQNKEDTETCKHLPEESDYFEGHFPLKKISSQSFLFDGRNTPEQSYYSNQVKFVSSQLMMASSTVLYAYFDDSFFQVMKHTRIGRSTVNDIVLKTEGVSRHHAEVLVEEDLDSNGKIQAKYYLKDVGSKFGTYVETDPEKPKKIMQNQFYCIGQTVIRIDKLKLNKSKQKFDLTLSIIQSQEQQRTYHNKSSVTIGNRRRQSQSKQTKSSQQTKRNPSSKQKRDLQLQDNQVRNYHCRFAVINGEIQFEQVQGNILERLQINARFPLLRNNYEVKFGDGNVLFKFQQMYKTLNVATD